MTPGRVRERSINAVVQLAQSLSKIWQGRLFHPVLSPRPPPTFFSLSFSVFPCSPFPVFAVSSPQILLFSLDCGVGRVTVCSLFGICTRDHSMRRNASPQLSLDLRRPVAAVRIWNSLPQHITSGASLPVFCSRLKTYFFELCCYP